MTTREILGQHDKFLDSLVDGFEDRLKPLLAAAQKRALKSLEDDLTFSKDGSIETTPANQRTLRSINRLFKTEMNRSTKQAPGGYKGLVDSFSAQFAEALPQFQDVLNRISKSLDGPPLPAIKFGAEDVDLFVAQATSAKDVLLDVLDATANAAKRQAMFSVGGLRFSDLAGELADQFSKTAAQATALADTSVSMFYRTIASQSYKKIEKGLAKGAVKFEYAGPDDSLTREFCDEMIDRTRDEPLTRDQIDGLDNGQIPGVFTSCGGFQCRHQWILSFADEQKDADDRSTRANLAGDDADDEPSFNHAAQLHGEAAYAHEAFFSK
jgi:hypothetical protein